jgi:protein subunit release factor A
VDEAVLQKLFPNSARSEVIKGATIALEDGEVADVEVLEASISDEEVAALLNPPQEPAADSQEPAAQEPAPEATQEPAAQTPNVHEDVVALIKAMAEQNASTQRMMAELLKEKDAKPAAKADDEAAKVLAELKEAQKALAKLVPPQDDRDERSDSTKGKSTETQSLGQMFSFLLS